MTKGSQAATAKAAPAAAAEIAVQAVWPVPNMPWMRPTSSGADPWVSNDCTAGMAAANPRASDPPSTTRAGDAVDERVRGAQALDTPRPASTSTRRSMWSANHPLGLATSTKGTANRVHEMPISNPDAPRATISRVQQMS